MRNRLDVIHNDIRTTARFPSYLWRLALGATGYTDRRLADLSVKRVRAYARHQPQKSASQLVIDFLVELIEHELIAVGFNPDTSRAQAPGRSADDSAAGASPT